MIGKQALTNFLKTLSAMVLICYSCPARGQKPDASQVVKELYGVVVALHPFGVPYGQAKTAIWPLLSKRLVGAFEIRNACDDDWKLQHPDPNTPPYILKPPGFYEVGLFSGGDELGYINGAGVESTTKQADGSYLVRVLIWSYLDDGLPELRTKKTYRWQVGVRVITEDGSYLVDDILFLKNKFNTQATYISKMIRSGCNGPRAIPDRH